MPKTKTTEGASAESTKIAVTMEDGSTVEFNQKQRLVKTPTIDESTGAVSVRLDFRNGAVRHFTIPQSLLLKFAAHGAEQKLGDNIASEKDIEDAVVSTDDLITRLSAGEWTAKREAGAFAGVSILMKAMVEATGKTLEQVKAFLSSKTAAEKAALRRSDRLAPIIARLEADRPKKTSVDVDALFDEING